MLIHFGMIAHSTPKFWVRQVYNSLNFSDSLTLFERSDSGIGFDIRRETENGNCSLDGVAPLQGDGYAFPDKEFRECHLRIWRENDNILLDDQGTCRAYCGQAARLGRISFRMKTD